MNYSIKGTPNTLQLTIALYGNLDVTAQLLNDNNLAIDAILTPGTVVTYNPSLFIPPVPPQSQQTAYIPVPVTLSYKGFYGQNLLDINNHTYGGLDNYVKMLVDNNLNSTNVNAGQTFNFTTSLVNDVNIYNYTTGKGVVFSTGINAGIRVYSNESQTIIYTSEDGKTIYTPE